MYVTCYTASWLLVMIMSEEDNIALHKKTCNRLNVDYIVTIESLIFTFSLIAFEIEKYKNLYLLN